MNLHLSQKKISSTEECIQANRKAWNKKVPYDIKSNYYDVENFKKGVTSLHEIDLQLLGDVENTKILHLQSYLGLDTMSLSRLGADATGVDFSEEAVKYAQKTCKELGLNTRFFCSDIYDLDSLDLKNHDKVYMSYGAICWLPDLNNWAKKISKVLKEDGEVCLIDFHPLAISMNLFKQNYIKYSYFNDKNKPIRIEREGTYADISAPIETVEYNWNHSIQEIMGAFLENGFSIKQFREYPKLPESGFPNLELQEDGFYHVKGAEDKYPLMFSLKAQK